MPAIALATGVTTIDKTNKNFLPSWNLHSSSRDYKPSKLICKLNKQLKLLNATEKNRAKKAGSECVCEGRNFTLSASGGFHRRHLLKD